MKKNSNLLKTSTLSLALISFFAPSLWAEEALPDSLQNTDGYTWTATAPADGSYAPSVTIDGTTYYVDTQDVARETSFSVKIGEDANGSTDISLSFTVSDLAGVITISYVDLEGNTVELSTTDEDLTDGTTYTIATTDYDTITLTIGATTTQEVDGSDVDTYSYISYCTTDSNSTVSGTETVSANATTTVYYTWSEDDYGNLKLTATTTQPDTYDFVASFDSSTLTDANKNYYNETATVSGAGITVTSAITQSFIGLKNNANGPAIASASAAGSVVGDFIGNSNTSNSAAYTSGGAVFLNKVSFGGVTGDFIGNYVYTTTSIAQGGAIFINGAAGKVGYINGDFIGNYVYSSKTNVNGGAIGNGGGTITTINGDFIGNYAYGAGTALGGAISNPGTITTINGDFIGNYVYSSSASSYAYGGAIYNTILMESLEGNFTDNYANGNNTTLGGAVYNSGTITFKATDVEGVDGADDTGSSYTYSGNYASTTDLSADGATLTSDDDANGGFLYQTSDGTATFNVATKSEIIIGEVGSVGYDSIAGEGIINKTGAGTLTVNSSMGYYEGTLNVEAGSMEYTNSAALGASSINIGTSTAVEGADTIATFVTTGEGLSGTAGTEATTDGEGNDVAAVDAVYFGNVITVYNDGALEISGGTLSYNNSSINATVSGDLTIGAGMSTFTGSLDATSADSSISFEGVYCGTIVVGDNSSISVNINDDLVSASSTVINAISSTAASLVITIEFDTLNLTSLADVESIIIYDSSKSSGNISLAWEDSSTADKTITVGGSEYTVSIGNDGNLTITLKDDGTVDPDGDGDDDDDGSRFVITEDTLSIEQDLFSNALVKSEDMAGGLDDTLDLTSYDEDGGIINNVGNSIGSIEGAFTLNSVSATLSGDVASIYTRSQGGAIFNAGTTDGTAEIASITGNFTTNTVSASSTGTALSDSGSYVVAASKGGAIYNWGYSATAQIGTITGKFEGNSATASASLTVDSASDSAMASLDAEAKGGAIANDADASDSSTAIAQISSIEGDFSANYVNATSTASDALLNSSSEDIFVAADARGGAIYNTAAVDEDSTSASATAQIGSITGSFEGNYATATASLDAEAQGGAIYNEADGAGATAQIGTITGNLKSNYVSATATDEATAQGGAIYNEQDGVEGATAQIGSIVGSIEGNSATATATDEATAQGGAIYNTGTIGGVTYGNVYYAGIEGDIKNNSAYASGSDATAQGGAVYNEGDITFKASDVESVGSTYTYSGNFASTTSSTTPSADDDANGGFLYQTSEGTATFDVDELSSIVIGTGTAGYDSIAGDGTINKTGAGSLTVNSSMKYYEGDLNIQAGSMAVNNDLSADSISISSGASLSLSSGTLDTSSISISVSESVSLAIASSVTMTWSDIDLSIYVSADVSITSTAITIISDATKSLTLSDVSITYAEGLNSTDYTVSIDDDGNLTIALNDDVVDPDDGDDGDDDTTGNLTVSLDITKTDTNSEGETYIYVINDDDDSLSGKLTVNVTESITVENDVYLVYGDAQVGTDETAGSVELNISAGTFYGDINVVGTELDSVDGNKVGTVYGDVVVNISGGTFYNDIYAGADTDFDYNANGIYNDGKITGNVTVNLSGEATFGASYYYSATDSNGNTVEGYAYGEAELAALQEQYDNLTYFDNVPSISGGYQTTGTTATLNIDKYNTAGADLGSFGIEDFDVIKVSGASNVNAELGVYRDLTMSVEGNSNFYGSSLEVDDGSASITVEEGSSLSFDSIFMANSGNEIALTVTGDISAKYIAMMQVSGEATSSINITGALTMDYLDEDISASSDSESALIYISDSKASFTAKSVELSIENSTMTGYEDYGLSVLDIGAGASFTADSLTLNLTDVTSYSDMYLVSADGSANINIGSIDVNIYNTLTMMNGAILNLSSGETANVYGTISGNISVGADSTLNVIIGSSNVGSTGILGSISGAGDYTIYISFDTESLSTVDLTSTTIYGSYTDATESEGSLTLAWDTDLTPDSDGNVTIVVGNTEYTVSIEDGVLSFEAGESVEPSPDPDPEDNVVTEGTTATFDKVEETTKVEGGDTTIALGTSTGDGDESTSASIEKDTAFVFEEDATEGTTEFSGNMAFEGTGDKTGVELNSDNTTLAGDFSATYNKDTDAEDSDDLTLIKTTTGTATFDDNTTISATIVDDNGTVLDYATAITNDHSNTSAEESNGLNVVLKGNLAVTGNIKANSPFILTADTVINNGVESVVTNAKLTLTGNIYTNTGGEEYIIITDSILNINGNIEAGSGDITVTNGSLILGDTSASTIETEGSITLIGSELDLGVYAELDGVSAIYMTTNTEGTMSTITVDSSADLDGAVVTLVGSASMLVGSTYDAAIDGVDADDVENKYGVFDVDANGNIKVESLSYFTDTATNANAAALGSALDSIEAFDNDDDANELLIAAKVEVDSQGVDSFIMDNNSNMTEVNSILLNNLNIANVNRSKDLLQKAKGSYLLVNGSNPKEADYIRDARNNSFASKSTVAQLQSINLLGSKDSVNGVAGYDYWSVGSTANMDQVLSEKAIVGISLGGVYSKTEGDSGDNANSTAFLLNFYGVYKPTDELDLFANLGYAHFWNEGSKGTAKAEWESNAINALIGASYKIDTGVKGLSVSPLAMLNMVYLNNGSAQYSNIGVEVNSESYLTAKLMLGFDLEYAITKNFAMNFAAMYSFELGDDSFDNTYSISKYGYSLNDIAYAGSSLGRDSGVIGIGFSYDFSDTCTGYFDYTAYLYETLITHSLNLSVALKF